MPDFDTRKPQEPDEPSRHPVASIADKLSVLLVATGSRVLSTANGLRSLPIANNPRTLSIGGAILLLVGVAITVGLPIYFYSGLGDGWRDSRIVFALDGAVWTMKADGSDMERLTHAGGGAEAPVWSPDGRKIAFTQVVQKPPESSQGDTSEVPSVFVMDAHNPGRAQLLGSHARDPAWSPDGEKIAFSVMDQNGWSDIYVTNANGSGTLRRLTTAPGEERFPAWSPDGEYIAFESERLDGRELDNYVDIYVMKACCVEGDTNQPQRLTDDPGWNRYPEWSPDGTEIAFTYIDFGSARLYGNSVIRNTDVHKVDAAGSETRLTHTDGERLPEHIAAWSPSGDRIAFVKGYYELTHSPNSSAMYVMGADGTDPTLIKEFPKKVAGYPDWFGPAKQTIADAGAEKDGVDWQAVGAARQDAVLPEYFEQMEGLLRWKDHSNTDEGRRARKLARDKTLWVLGVSDPSQKRKVVRFLLEADVLQSANEMAPFISLSDANLEGADLSELNLSGAELDSVKLKEADLGGTDLSDANLGGADLTGSDSRQAVLSGAYLYESYLEKAELIGADLSGANLLGAQLKGADLSGANLTNTNLMSADLTNAELKGAELKGAELKGAELRDANIALPDEYESRVRAWELEARSQLRDFTAAVNSCLVKHTAAECAAMDFAVSYNIAYQMIPQTDTEVLIRVQHAYGGGAFQSSTAVGGRIERIPKFY